MLQYDIGQRESLSFEGGLHLLLLFLLEIIERCLEGIKVRRAVERTFMIPDCSLWLLAMACFVKSDLIRFIWAFFSFTLVFNG